MKIATWNANMAFRKKQQHFMEALDPDVFIIQECESPDFFDERAYKPAFWTGDNKHKGLAVFSKLPATRIDNYCEAKHYIAFTAGALYFVGIWAINDEIAPENRYIGQVWNIINSYSGLLDGNVVLLGDFNWNVYWDSKPTYPLVGNLRNVVDRLSQFHVASGYHTYFHEDFGTETRPTYFQYRRIEKPYHTDFIFLTEGMPIHDFSVGNPQQWIKWSDHVPLCVEI